ncbi:MAG: hypothetical protein Q9190_003591 [Brigantiaea leucoxantha]
MSALWCQKSTLTRLQCFVGILLALLLQCSCAEIVSVAKNAATNASNSNYDVVECDAMYGENLHGNGCRQALANIYPGRIPRLLSVVKHRRGSSSTTIQVPFEYKDGDSHPSCVITIDLAGPPFRDDTNRLLSYTLRSLVESVITHCVDRATWGGFATYGIKDTGDGLFSRSRGTFNAPLFLTVSITSPYRRNFRPGDTDPRIIPPLQSVLAFWRDEAFRQASKDKVTVMINQLGLQFSRMTEGGRKAWWDSQRFDEVSPGGVGYECKPELGAHGALPIRDCEFASYGFINEGHAPRITPNEPLKFHSGQCVFKAEATQGSADISWAALRAAADILLYRCLEAAHAPATGGQVVYTGAPGSSTSYDMPQNLLITMGKVGIVHETHNDTIGEGGSTTAAGGTQSGLQPVNGSSGVVTDSDQTS